MLAFMVARDTTEFGRSRKPDHGTGRRTAVDQIADADQQVVRAEIDFSNSSSSSSKQPWMSPTMTVRCTRASLGRNRFSGQTLIRGCRGPCSQPRP